MTVGNKYFVDKAVIYAKLFFSKFIIQMNDLVFNFKAAIKWIKGMKIEATRHIQRKICKRTIASLFYNGPLYMQNFSLS